MQINSHSGTMIAPIAKIAKNPTANSYPAGVRRFTYTCSPRHSCSLTLSSRESYSKLRRCSTSVRSWMCVAAYLFVTSLITIDVSLEAYPRSLPNIGKFGNTCGPMCFGLFVAILIRAKRFVKSASVYNVRNSNSTFILTFSRRYPRDDISDSDGSFHISPVGCSSGSRK